MQVRQHTEHKRTFMFLEQVILKYNAASTCINVKDIHEVRCRLQASNAIDAFDKQRQYSNTEASLTSAASLTKLKPFWCTSIVTNQCTITAWHLACLCGHQAVKHTCR